MPNKNDLRSIYKKKRAVIEDNTLNAASKIIYDLFIKYIGKKKLSILLYHSSIAHHEIPTIHWFLKLKKQHSVFVPKVLDNLLDMEAIKWTEKIKLEKNKFGIRIENLIYVKENNKKMNFENLTMAPIDKDLIVPERLDKNEKKWINNYHKTVYKNLKKSMNKVDALELKKACSAI